MNQQDSLGTILKHYREEAGLSVEQIEAALKISRRNIVALESGDYSSLPENLYTKNFVESYARHLGLSVPKIHALYIQERSEAEKDSSPRQNILAPKQSSFTLTPTHLKVGAGIIVAIGLLVYLAFQVQQIFSPPKLIILSPEENLITQQTFVDVSGQTEREAIIHVNDKEIHIDRDGYFTTTLDLNEGINVIKISSKKKIVVNILSSDKYL